MAFDFSRYLTKVDSCEFEKGIYAKSWPMETNKASTLYDAMDGTQMTIADTKAQIRIETISESDRCITLKEAKIDTILKETNISQSDTTNYSPVIQCKTDMEKVAQTSGPFTTGLRKQRSFQDLLLSELDQETFTSRTLCCSMTHSCVESGHQEVSSCAHASNPGKDLSGSTTSRTTPISNSKRPILWRPEKGPRRKKSVCFPDDEGQPLVAVKVIERVSSIEERFLLRSLRQQNNVSFKARKTAELITTFPPPVSHGSKVQNKIETENVALENIITYGMTLMGTIKVKNVAYDKEVFIRLTTDKWCSHRDTPGMFVPSDSGTEKHDRFSFQFSASAHLSQWSDSVCEQELEFAICYRVNGQEHWDNNGGQNYKLLVIK